MKKGLNERHQTASTNDAVCLRFEFSAMSFSPTPSRTSLSFTVNVPLAGRLQFLQLPQQLVLKG